MNVEQFLRNYRKSTEFFSSLSTQIPEFKKLSYPLQEILDIIRFRYCVRSNTRYEREFGDLLRHLYDIVDSNRKNSSRVSPQDKIEIIKYHKFSPKRLCVYFDFYYNGKPYSGFIGVGNSSEGERHHGFGDGKNLCKLEIRNESYKEYGDMILDAEGNIYSYSPTIQVSKNLNWCDFYDSSFERG